MASREMIEIILKAEDQASQVFKQNEQNVKKFGDAAKQANEKARQSSEKVKSSLEKQGQEMDKVIDDYIKVGNEGKKSFDELSKSQQDAVIKFNTLDRTIQTTLEAIREVGSSDIFPDGNHALESFQNLNNLTKSWSGSLEYAKSKMQLLGNDTTSLRGKIQTTGMAIQTYLGTKWDTIKTKVSGVAQSIEGKIGSAIDFVKGKLSGLGGGFNNLKAGANSAGQSLGFLRSAASMAAGMIGFELFNNMVQAGRASLNAASQLDYFASRLGMNSSQVTEFNNNLNKLQQDFRKVDMTAVGASAEELAVKLQLPIDSLTGLSETIAVTSSAFVKEGRTQEDAILAVSDALDGQWAKLKELGITQEDLKNNGWNGDLEDKQSLLEGLNGTLQKMGFTDTAKDITTLDEAFSALSVSGGQLLRDVLVPLTPTLISIVEYAITAVDTIKSVWNSIPDGGKIAIGIGAIAIALGILVPALTAAEVASLPLIGTLYSIAGAVMAISWPVVAVVAAIGLLVFAIYEVGKAFGWWNNVGDMISAITAGVQRLWSAFINNPDVQGLIKAISDAWAWLAPQIEPAIQGVLKFLGVSSDGKFDIVHTIIMAVGGAFHSVANAVRAAIPYLQAAWGFLSWLVGSAIGIGQGIYNALKPIVCILLGCSPGIVPALQTVFEVFSSVWNNIAGFIGGVITTIVSAIQPIIDILTMIAEFYLTSFIYAWQTLIMVFNIVVAGINRLIYTFTLFLNGQISLQTMLSMIWSTLSQMFALVLTTILSRVSSWASSLLAKAINAGRNFVNNIIRFISTLPGQFASYLTQVFYRIISAGASWVSSASSKASEMVSAMMNYISQLPGKVYNEFMEIGSRMLAAGSDLVNKARQIGEDIVNGLLDAMGIHSPGTIQTSVIKEFVDMVKGVGNKIKSAYDTAKSMGEAIVEGFGNPSLETDTSNMLPSEDAFKTAMGIQAQLAHPMEEASSAVTANVDTTSVTEGNTEVVGSYDNLSTLTGAALQNMVDRDKLAYDTMKNNDAQTLSAMTTNLQQKMTLMTNNVSSSMNNIVSKNRTGMNTVTNTTKSQLNTIVSKTKSANSEMISSWEYMKNGIISAADKIRSDSTNHFNKLSNTIGDFYGKLKNPSRWGAGSPVTRSKSSNPSRGFSKITSAIRNASLPSYLTLGQMRRNPLIGSNYIGDYVTKDPKNGRFNVADLVRYGVISLMNRGAGSYSDIPSPNVKLIKDTSNEWDMAGPLVGPYSTSKGFKVKEFLEGVPRIAYDTFRQIAEEVYSQTSYEFYYDDDHHGNWINAFNAGSMNCKHGAESIVAMANAMGLSGYMQHGHWTDASGTYGHYYAVIEGHKMDVTGWQQRRTWTPSASAGPTPKGYGFKDFVEILKSLFDGDDNPRSTGGGFIGDSKITGEFTIIHDFINLPEGVSAEDVAKMVEDSATNEGFLKKIAQHPAFQRYDLREKVKIERQNNRARGV